MNAQTQSLTLDGPAGALEAVLDLPDAAQFGAPRGTAVIAHPHPQFAGTMTNKVVQTLARACVQTGWRALRFNFRGVGASAGQWDEGRGEVDDMRAALAAVAPPGEQLVIAGFSFGAYVASQVIATLHTERAIERVVVDDTVPLASVMDWARPQSLPVTVVPGGEHFFHGQIALLKTLVVRHLRW